MSPDSDFYERFIQQYANGLREGHRFAAESQEHCDRMLTWAIGLMGAGILGSHEILKPLSSGWQALVLSPWLLGILVALVGRLLGRVVVEKDNLFFFEKVKRLESAVFHSHGEELQGEINAIMTDADTLGEKRKSVKRLNARLTRLYYAAHILLGIGVLTVLGASLCGPR